MRLPRNVRPNPNQALANEQWSDVVRSQYITAHQGLNPRSVVGHPAQVAQAALFSQDVPYGNDPTRTGDMGTAWYAALQAKSAEASQTLKLQGLEGYAYGRVSGTLNRALRVRRMPVGALGAVTSPGDGPCAVFPSFVIDAYWGYRQSLIEQGRLEGSGPIGPEAEALFGPGIEQCALNINSAEQGRVRVLLDRPSFQTAYKRMTERGWWSKRNWEFYWRYLSGYTPLYKNTLAWLVGGTVAVTAYQFGKK